MSPSLSIGLKPKTANRKLKDQKPLEFKDLRNLSSIWSIYTRHRRIAYIKLEIVTTQSWTSECANVELSISWPSFNENKLLISTPNKEVPNDGNGHDKLQLSEGLQILI